MLTKTIYIIVDIIAAADILFILLKFARVKAAYGKWLVRTLAAGVLAILANMLVAGAHDELSAQIAYCLYFASIDWILYFLTGFFLLYTEHDKILNKIYIPAACIMIADSLFILTNPALGMHFTVYEKAAADTVFYQTAFMPMYYVHLALDYSLVLLAFFFLIFKIVKSYGIYRSKYVIMLSVLLFVIIMNLVYMSLALVLDASVVFYAVVGTLIYFCTEVLVPRGLMRSAVARAVDDMSEGLILFDINHNLIYANAFSKLHFDIDPSSYDFSCEPVDYVISQLKKEGKHFGEVSFEKPTMTGTEYFKIRYTSLTDKKVREIGSYFLIQDTTEEVFYLHEIEDAREYADNANRAKSTFLANMSHEIRTPLNSVLGMNEMILRTSEDPRIREYAENIKSSGDTLLSLINDILDFSKIEAGRMDVIKTEYDPQKLIRDCYYFFALPASEKGLYLNVEFDDKIPRRLVGDMLHIKQILTNLISNAVKYTMDGGITVKVTFRKAGRESIDLVISVTDTGMGIERKDQALLFDAFKRINEKDNASIQGTGLGLAICRELVENMKGDITVDSSPGLGSIFTVTLPQDVADQAHAGALLLKKDLSGDSYRESFRAPKAYILVVDDVPVNIKVVKALLKDTLMEIDGASSGDKAIELCSRIKYDVILLDHRMPKKDGIETFNEISQKGLNTETPVVMLTANALHGAEEEYKEIGFAGYLSKPVDATALEKLLTELLPEEKVEIRK